MAYKDLRDFLRDLQKDGELAEITAVVDPKLEITEIYDRVVKKGGPALLFKKIRGTSMPLVINLFGSEKRMAKALGVEKLTHVAERIESLLDSKVPTNLWEKLWMLPKLLELNAILPKTVGRGVCQEIVVRPGEGPVLDKLPVIQCWPKDGGKFITLPLVFTKDPLTGKRNIGMYRMQVYDNVTTGMHWHVHKDGAEHYRSLGKGGRKRLEAACVIGSDPATVFSAACPLPRGIDELMFAGFLRQSPVELVKCRTVDLEVPANAEIVLEGYVEAGDMRMEGPFGDHTGFYSRAKEFPVFHVTCMTHRKDAIYAATVVGRPPMEDCYMGLAIEQIFLPLIQKQFPEITDLHLPWEGSFHNCVVAAIRKTYPGQGKKIIHGLWGLGQLMFSKMIVVLDHDANVRNMREVAWRTLNNFDPKRDVVFGEGPLDELDHGALRDFSGSKIGIDATRKSEAEGMERPWPEDIVMSEDIKKLVESRWEEYGLDPKFLA
ncbi:MAG: 3-octaprenyl-4-hydroxybenzoate carboxy-lyase [Candidatus Omnitrophica bacterium ADurb.Bin277]|nr:MAG: 3-octaprenyl-4-hydroxybenzoate carboxy-lyase [Candidatus Omnitrophica bacterium ADurb.Bin277]